MTARTFYNWKGCANTIPYRTSPKIDGGEAIEALGSGLFVVYTLIERTVRLRQRFIWGCRGKNGITMKVQGGHTFGLRW